MASLSPKNDDEQLFSTCFLPKENVEMMNEEV